MVYLKRNFLDLKEAFTNLDFILYSIPQLKNIIEKVFTSEQKIEFFNENEQLFLMLDEIFDDFKYETLRFILEWKNTNGNLKEIMRIREIKPLKTFALSNEKSLKNCIIIIDELLNHQEQNENSSYNPNMLLIEKTIYNEGQEQKVRIKACGYPDTITKKYNLDESYFKIARKSIKSLSEKPLKLFSIDFPMVYFD